MPKKWKTYVSSAINIWIFRCSETIEVAWVLIFLPSPSSFDEREWFFTSMVFFCFALSLFEKATWGAANNQAWPTSVNRNPFKFNKKPWESRFPIFKLPRLNLMVRLILLLLSNFFLIADLKKRRERSPSPTPSFISQSFVLGENFAPILTAWVSSLRQNEPSPVSYESVFGSNSVINRIGQKLSGDQPGRK